MKHQIILLLLVTLTLCSCSPAATTMLLPSVTPLPAAASPIPPTATFTPTAMATSTTAPTATTIPTQTATPVEKLRVTITINMAVCHYAPGKPYLYKYGVYQGYNMEALSRDVTNTYVEVQAIGGDNPCWVNAEYLDFKGDMNTLKVVRPEEIVLPMSPYYAPPVGIKAERNGDEVTVIWVPLNLKAGDSSEQTPYIIEAWVCQAGELVFQPVGFYQTKATIQDKAGCEQPSRARLLAAEKHGYTRPVEIDWPGR
jgi:hypothetical protein